MVQAVGTETNEKGISMTTKKRAKTVQHAPIGTVTVTYMLNSTPPVGHEPGKALRHATVPEETWNRAIHRAAHVVAYLRLGLPCSRVSILPSTCSKGVTSTKYYPGYDFDLLDGRQVDGHLVALFAGMIVSHALDQSEDLCSILGDDPVVVGCMLAVTSSSAKELHSRADKVVMDNLDLIVQLAIRLCLYGTQDARELALLMAATDGDEHASYQLQCLDDSRSLEGATSAAKESQ
jgi:hypothetical protein